MKKIEYKEYIQKTKDYYDDKFGTINGGDKLNAEEVRRWEIIKEHLEKITVSHSNRDIQILDFGCGDGRFSALLSNYGKVTGIDISDKSIEKARILLPNCDFFVGDVCSSGILDLFDCRFDVVVSTEVVEHVLEQEEYLKNGALFLKEGGFLILTTPNGKCYRHYFGNKKLLKGQAFEFWISPQQLKIMLRKVGFRILVSKCFFSEWIFHYGIRSWLRLLFNRYSFGLISKIGLLPQVFWMVRRSGYGLYSLVVAQRA